MLFRSNSVTEENDVDHNLPTAESQQFDPWLSLASAGWDYNQFGWYGDQDTMNLLGLLLDQEQH